MSRRAFTLLELLVSVTIIGILALMILPAVQSSREASRRADCLGRLKQIGVALASHHNAKGAFPYGQLPNAASTAQKPWAFGPVSLHAQLLPYLDQLNCFDALNFQLQATQDGVGIQVFQAAENSTAANTAVTVFLCPSDGLHFPAGNNYRGSVGPFPSESDDSFSPGGGHGAFPGLLAVSLASFRDGLSQTIGLSERLQGSGFVSGIQRDRDIWFSGAMNVKRLPDRDAVLKACDVLRSNDPPSWNRAGSTWIRGDYVDTLYNHVAPPNWKGPDCSADLPSGVAGDISTGAISARSSHRGGVNCLFMDGSAKFAIETINLQVWRALGSRDGGEVLSDAEF